MEIQTCPHCRMVVLPSADGTCPSCRLNIIPLAEPVFAAPLSAFADKAYVARPAFTPEEGEVNPYASPVVVDVKPNAPFEKPAGQGLAWILFSFQGRIPRRVYWGASIGTGVVFYTVIFLVMGVASAMGASGPQPDGDPPAIVLLIVLLMYVPIVWISLVLQVKRWHDRDKSGWWVLINVIPYIGAIWAFVELGCLRGTYGKNQFGPDST